VRGGRNAEWSNAAASQSKTSVENCGLMRENLWRVSAMIRFGRPALAAALVLMLAPLAREVRTTTTGMASAGVELVRAGNPAYPPCAWAKPGRACYDGHGLSTAGGHRRR
jgi:hypothetical protein